MFPQYKETCEVPIDDPKIWGENIKYFTKKAIRNILNANIDVHSRILVTEFPGYGITCIENFQSHRANMTFSDKSRYDRIFRNHT